MINNVIKHNFLNLNKVVHGFFSSSGGFSKGPYKSLNCSFNNEDSKKNVFKNLEKIRNHLCLKQLIQIKQIHSNKVIHLKKSNFLKPVEADGMVTKMNNVGLCILTADCSPILFYDDKEMILGACHAGWKGAVNEIIKSTVQNMEKIGSRKQNITAVIGPTIQKNSYEIGSEVNQLIMQTDVFKKNKDVIFSLKNNKYLFDLPLFIKEKLLIIGIDKIGDVHLDTYTNKQFFSYRRKTHENAKNKKNNNNSFTGRQISIIGLI